VAKQNTARRVPAHVHEGREGGSSPSPDRPVVRHLVAESHAHLVAHPGACFRKLGRVDVLQILQKVAAMTFIWSRTAMFWTV
jgi:hypothetical protein